MAADSRSPRDGKHLEVLGYYNPLPGQDGGKRMGLNFERVKYWLSVGAQPSESVQHILFRAGVLPPPPMMAMGRKGGPRDTLPVDPMTGRILTLEKPLNADQAKDFEGDVDGEEGANIQREEKSVQKATRDAAKRNDMGSAKALAKEIVRSRRTVNRLYENKAQMNSVSMHLGESVAIARTVGHLSKSAEVMKLVNNLMKAPQMAVSMQEFSKEMIKAGIIEEMVNDAVDSALDSEDIEDEIEEVDKVLTAIAGETAAQLPEAVRKERVKQPAQVVAAAEEEEAIAEGADDDKELEEIRARLAKVRS